MTITNTLNKHTMKITAIYVKAGANPFLNNPGDYKRTTAYFRPNADYDEIIQYAQEATPRGYVFAGIESEMD